MTLKQTWIVVTKSKPLEGCEIDFDGCDFYFADAYVALPKEMKSTQAIITALNKIEKVLEQDRLELTEIKLCAHFLPEEWIDQTDSIETMHALAASALETDDVVLSGFRSEEIQELYQYHHSVQEHEAK
jgi:hypothetical protein